ncbi:MAG: hypothetical protein ACI4PF_01830, partial [Christensenellales bacterium]
PITADTTFIAVIDYFYDVTITKDGQTVFSSLMAKNSSISYSANTERQYYIFNGYYVGDTQINLSTYKVTSDVTIVEKYTINSGMYDYKNDIFYTWQEMIDQNLVTITDGHILESVRTPSDFSYESDYCIDYDQGLFVVVDDSIDTIGLGSDSYTYVFASQHFVGAYIPSSVQLIKTKAFVNAVSIQNLELYDFRGTLEVGCFTEMYSLEKVFINKEVTIAQSNVIFNYMWQSQLTIFTDAPSRPDNWCDEYNMSKYRVKTVTTSNYYEKTLSIVYNSSYETYPYYYWYEIAASTTQQKVNGITTTPVEFQFQVSGMTQEDFDNGLIRININSDTIVINSLNSATSNNYTFSMAFDNRQQIITLIVKPTKSMAGTYNLNTIVVEHYKYFPEVA